MNQIISLIITSIPGGFIISQQVNLMFPGQRHHLLSMLKIYRQWFFQRKYTPPTMASPDSVVMKNGAIENNTITTVDPAMARADVFSD